jgi:hypothetical protein
VYGYSQVDTVKGILSFFRGFLLLGENYNSYPLWYLLSLSYSLLAMLFLAKRKVRFQNVWLLSLCIFIIGSIFSFIEKNAATLAAPLQVFARLYSITLGDSRLFNGFFFLTCGIALYRLRLKPSILVCVFCCVCGVLGELMDSSGMTFIPIIVIPLFLIFVSVKWKDSKLYRVFRLSSTVMYFTHMIFYSIYLLLIGLLRYEENGVAAFGFSLAGSLMLSLFVIMLREKKSFKWLKTLFG